MPYIPSTEISSQRLNGLQSCCGTLPHKLTQRSIFMQERIKSLQELAYMMPLVEAIKTTRLIGHIAAESSTSQPSIELSGRNIKKKLNTREEESPIAITKHRSNEAHQLLITLPLHLVHETTRVFRQEFWHLIFLSRSIQHCSQTLLSYSLFSHTAAILRFFCKRANQKVSTFI